MRYAIDRRSLLALAGAAAVSGPATAAAGAFFQRHSLPVGIQLYTLGPDLAKDLDGTLKAVADIGYGTVELAGLLGRTPAQMRAAFDKAGLKCTSAHFQGRPAGPEPSLGGDVGKVIEAAHALGATSVVMPLAYIPDRLAKPPAAGEDFVAYLRRTLAQLTADDWKMNADFLNEKGAALKKAGLKLGYHNHNFEFAPLGGTNGLEILLKNTDPALVTFEVDIGWVAAAGVDPLAFLNAHKGRVSLMHVKDIKADTKANHLLAMDPAEIGAGRLQWARLLPAAYAAGVRGFFVEQEPPFTRPRIEAAKISYDYLARVQA
jgi:sugar phosphate isomerase/epimerase